MRNPLTLKNTVLGSLLIFAFALVNILLYGLVDSLAGEYSLVFFRTAYFILAISVLAVILYLNRQHLRTRSSFALICAGMIIFSLSMAFYAGGLKYGIDIERYINEDNSLAGLEDQNVFLRQSIVQANQSIEAIRENIGSLDQQLKQLDSEISNRTPIIVETVVTLPPEVIYVQEQADSDASAQATPLVDDDSEDEYEYEREYEEEEDD